MTEHEIGKAIFENQTKEKDKRPLLVRLLGSLKLKIKFGKKLKKPIDYVGIEGKIEF